MRRRWRGWRALRERCVCGRGGLLELNLARVVRGVEVPGTEPTCTDVAGVQVVVGPAHTALDRALDWDLDRPSGRRREIDLDGVRRHGCRTDDAGADSVLEEAAIPVSNS